MNRSPFPAAPLLALAALLACGGGGGGGSSTPPPPPPPPTGPSFQVLMNTGFEQASPLIWQGDTGIIMDAPGSTEPGVVPHGGTLFAWLGGYGGALSDQITQDVYIPASAQAATATFYVKIITSETGTTAKDTLTVSALRPSGSSLGTLLTKSNADASAYKAYTADLLPYKGQTVRLSFKSQEDAQNATSFLLDDVTLSIAVPAASDLKPLITSFTPASGIAGETTVQIAGGNFFGVTAVAMGGVNATFTLTDGTGLSAAVPDSVTGSAPIDITNGQGTTTSSTSFSTVFGAPTLTGVNPTQGPLGTPVVVTGTYLDYPGTTLALNGMAITPASQSRGRITFLVPAGATSGNLVITTPGGRVEAPFTVTASGTTFDMHIEKAQLTQSTQTLNNTVPIVAGKAGLIRVFVLANQANTAAPNVRITLLNGGVPVAGYPKVVAAPAVGVPMDLSEGSLGASWNLAVPASDLAPPSAGGYSLQAILDPGGTIPEADLTNNAFTAPLSGTPVPVFRTTLFPVVLSTGTGNVSEANKDAWVARLAKMYPVAEVDVAVGAAFTPSASASTLSSDGSGWNTLLSELATKHQVEGASNRYYFGAVTVDYGNGTAGLGYVPSSSSDPFQYRTAIGWDKTGYKDGGNFPEVFAHETGHNMGRGHSPCGGVSGADPAFPYAGGSIGVWGYDSVLDTLKDPALTKDIMGYCSPNWVSDYVYKKILDFRGAPSGFLQAGAIEQPSAKGAASARECLIVRGLIHGDGRVELLPSFRTRALPSTFPGQGEYAVECLDQKGAAIFTATLEPVALGCGPAGGERHFIAALPLEAAALDAIAGLDILRAGQIKASRRSLPASTRAAAGGPDLRRLDGERVQLSWDAAVHPAAMVRDGDSGEVLAILSGGRHAFAAKGRRFEVVLSDGVTGPTQRIEPAD